MAGLCLWAAVYHTPVGALARTAGGWALGVKASTRPLLAYYSSGVYDEHAMVLTDIPPPPPTRPSDRGPLPAEEALAYGVYATAVRASAVDRAMLLSIADKHGISEQRVLDAKEGPPSMGKLLNALTNEMGSEDVALAALFWGVEPARFARDRVKAEGRTPTLEALAAELPPGFGLGDKVSLATQAATLGTAYGLSWPVPEDTKVTSPFGYRVHPILGTRQMHTGVDLSVPSGTLVHVTADGTVRRASEDSVNGRVVIVDHGRGVTTAYCHNEELLVRSGEKVSRGEVISHSGSTGRSTGPHLHYQLEFGGTPVDPFVYHLSNAVREKSESFATTD
jgi:hypothetical protein